MTPFPSKAASSNAVRVYFAVFATLLAVLSISGQPAQYTQNKADQTLRGSGRVNASTLGMEFDLPLGGYPGRGINVPVSLSYSSKLWRMQYMSSQPQVNNPSTCISVSMPEYSETSASGWTTSMAAPYIEYTGEKDIFDNHGGPAGSDASLCDPMAPPNYSNYYYVRRVAVHLPGDETMSSGWTIP